MLSQKPLLLTSAQAIADAPFSVAVLIKAHKATLDSESNERSRVWF